MRVEVCNVGLLQAVLQALKTKEGSYSPDGEKLNLHFLLKILQYLFLAFLRERGRWTLLDETEYCCISPKMTISPQDVYAVVQLSCFLTSCAGLCLYGLRTVSLPPLLQIDEYRELWIEAALLIIRALNEYLTGHFDQSDTFHHSATLLGMYLVCALPGWERWTWLAVHMQILHFPMSFWYLGGRKRCVLTALRDNNFRGKEYKMKKNQAKRRAGYWLWDWIVLRGFRALWLVAASYRCALLFLTSWLLLGELYSAQGNEEYRYEDMWLLTTQTLSVFCFNVIFSMLDLHWTRAFFSGEVPWPSSTYVILAICAGFVAALLVSFELV